MERKTTAMILEAVRKACKVIKIDDETAELVATETMLHLGDDPLDIEQVVNAVDPAARVNKEVFVHDGAVPRSFDTACLILGAVVSHYGTTAGRNISFEPKPGGCIQCDLPSGVRVNIYYTEGGAKCERS